MEIKNPKEPFVLMLSNLRQHEESSGQLPHLPGKE